MTAGTVPSPERVLRALFWKLLFRGRAALGQDHQRRKRRGLGATLIVYGLFGLMPALSAFVLPPLAFASSLHAFTLLFASLTLASSAGTMLFVREEAEILLHRPVRAEELLRAKAAVLLGHSLLLALALNGTSLVTCFWNPGNAPWFFAAHAVTTLLLMLLSAAAVVLVYNVCLRWFGRERFENLLTLVQTLLTVVMVAGSQLIPRLWDRLEGVDVATGWALALPPVWFGALDLVLCGVDAARYWPLALLAVLSTALVAWLAFVRLGASYGIGLLALNEAAAPDAARPRRRRLRRLVQAAPLRWWLRNPVERQAFLLTSAYLLRDRETKLKLYPALTPLVVMPLVLAIGPRSGRGGPSVFLATMGIAYAVIVPLQALQLLRHSEQWRAAALFQVAAVPHWTPLFHGARKAVLIWLAVPGLALVTAILAGVQGSWLPVALALPTMAAMPLCALLPALGTDWLPLAEPSDDVRHHTGCLLFGGAVLACMALGAVGAWLDGTGWFWPYATALVLLSLGAQWLLTTRLRARPWRAPR